MGRKTKFLGDGVTPVADLAYHNRNLLLARMGYNSYAEYLASDLWKGIRRRVLLKRGVCKVCHQPATDVHHLSYSRAVLTGANLKSLVPLCRGCHARVELDEGGRKLPFSRSMKNYRSMVGLPEVPQPSVSRRQAHGPVTRNAKQKRAARRRELGINKEQGKLLAAECSRVHARIGFIRNRCSDRTDPLFHGTMGMVRRMELEGLKTRLSLIVEKYPDVK